MKLFMKSALALCGAGALATTVIAQNVATINFDSAPNALTLPDDIYFGEVGGVATNSRGDIFVYTRTGHPTLSLGTARPFAHSGSRPRRVAAPGRPPPARPPLPPGTARPFAHSGSRLFQFDRNGRFTREIGQGIYGFLFAAQV